MAISKIINNGAAGLASQGMTIEGHKGVECNRRVSDIGQKALTTMDVLRMDDEAECDLRMTRGVEITISNINNYKLAIDKESIEQIIVELLPGLKIFPSEDERDINIRITIAKGMMSRILDAIYQMQAQIYEDFSKEGSEGVDLSIVLKQLKSTKVSYPGSSREFDEVCFAATIILSLQMEEAVMQLYERDDLNYTYGYKVILIAV